MDFCKPKYYRAVTACCILFFFFLQNSYAQKYAFFKYNVQDGLVQSQVNSFCQDSNHYLWIATNGGLSRFDGVKFISFSKQDGLVSNYTTKIFADTKNNIWVGTQFGLSCFNGETFKNYFFKNNVIRYITEDNTGSVWVIAGVDLYRINAGRMHHVQVVKNQENIFSCFEIDDKKQLWVSVYKSGIFCLQNNTWIKKVNALPQHENDFYTSIIFRHQDIGLIVLVDENSIKFFANGRIQKEISADIIKGKFITAKDDAFSNLWIVGTNGLYEYINTKLILFSAANGFTDNHVNNLFKDDENNMWFATEGAGMYRYSFNNFRFFDASTGLKNALITGIAETGSNVILFSSYGDGLYMYSNNKITNLKLPSCDQKTQTIACIYNDINHGLLVGTENGGLWLYKRNRFIRIDNSFNKLPQAYNSIYKDNKNAFWFATPYGLFYYNSGISYKLLPAFSTGVISIGNDSIVAGSVDGLYLITHANHLQKITVKEFDLSSTVCFARKKNYLFIGTEDNGIIIWDFKKNTFKNITTKNGLSSNFIYSLFNDDSVVWVGTGKGINEVRFTSSENYSIINLSESEAFVSGECNQNAVLKDHAGNIWFGFSEGVAVCSSPVYQSNSPPHIMLQSVQLFSKNVTKGKYATSFSRYNNIPQDLQLPFDQNHLTFEFIGINFKNAALIQYQYKLNGLDKDFSDLNLKPFVVYPSLPPGDYSFTVRAFEPGVGYSDNVATLPFVITAPFYKTTWFSILMIVLLVCIVIFAQAYYIHVKAKRAKQLKNLKTEEKNKIRQKTSEDFHDELGNKLTRIAVLADILQTKSNNKTEVEKITAQIKENVSALYKGTKDILWSLNPESDKLNEIVKHLDDFGAELFSESEINFEFEQQTQISSIIKVPEDFSRNLLMIFKEAMNNILKHAQCKNVKLAVYMKDFRKVVFILQDDGRGFQIDNIKKGFGLNNMKARADRINSILNIKSDSNGTILNLVIEIPNDAGIA